MSSRPCLHCRRYHAGFGRHVAGWKEKKGASLNPGSLPYQTSLVETAPDRRELRRGGYFQTDCHEDVNSNECVCVAVQTQAVQGKNYVNLAAEADKPKILHGRDH
jgi:hypothetical protein